MELQAKQGKRILELKIENEEYQQSEFNGMTRFPKSVDVAAFLMSVNCEFIFVDNYIHVLASDLRNCGFNIEG